MKRPVLTAMLWLRGLSLRGLWPAGLWLTGLWFTGLWLTGCQHWQENLSDTQLGDTGAAACLSQSAANASTDAWLVARPCICASTTAAPATSGLSGHNRAYEVLFVLQASCNPEQLSGAGLQHLHDLTRDPSWNAQQAQMISLVFEHASRVQALRTEAEAAAQKLRSTIEGIHDIESEMNSLDAKDQSNDAN